MEGFVEEWADGINVGLDDGWWLPSSEGWPLRYDEGCDDRSKIG